MCLSATIVRPLRSKRAMISPVRPRAKASGLTRMSVRSMGSGSFQTRKVGDGRREPTRRALGPGLGGLGRGARPARALGGRGGGGRDGLHLGLAVRADPPVGVERLGAARAGVLELAQAV